MRLARALATLSELFTSGKLTAEEYGTAKASLLSGAGRLASDSAFDAGDVVGNDTLLARVGEGGMGGGVPGARAVRW
jgi:hypothetical protein